ncbi:MAG: hypothetical protein ABII06_06725 [Pseudomonadota bacterium]
MNTGVLRKKLLALLIFPVLPLLAFASPGLSAEGVVISIKGKVTVSAHGADSPARAGMRLKPGFKVQSLGGTASLLLDDGKMHSIKEGGSFTVPPGESAGVKDNMASRLMDTIRETTLRGKGPTIKGMVRGEREIALIYPFNSFITPDELRFEWEATVGLADLEISLKSPSPVYQFAFKPGPGENRALFPEKGAPLSPGVRYYWKVTGFDEAKGETYRSKLAWFTILDPQKTEALKGEINKIEATADLEEGGKAYLTANLFISYGLHHRAVRVIEESLARNPENTGMKELLQGVFAKMKK